MEQIVTEVSEEITQTSVKVPTNDWLEFRGVVTRRGRKVNECLLEAIRAWLAAQPN